MKKYVFIAAALLLMAAKCHSQTNLKTVVSTLNALVDQYGHSIDKKTTESEVVVFYITGLDDPMTLFFDKLKEKKIVGSTKVLLVASLEKIAGEIDHIQTICRSRYGDQYFPILLDAKGSISKELHSSGLVVMTINQKNNKISYKDYGTDRKSFLAVVNQYFK